MVLRRDRENTAPGNGGQASVRATRKKLKRLVHGKPARVRARAGAKLVTGEFAYTAPTVPQAARIVGCPAKLIHAELGHQPKRRPSDARIDVIVAKLGLERVLAALDRPPGRGARRRPSCSLAET